MTSQKNAWKIKSYSECDEDFSAPDWHGDPLPIFNPCQKIGIISLEAVLLFLALKLLNQFSLDSWRQNTAESSRKEETKRISTWIWKKSGFSHQQVLERWWSASSWSGRSLGTAHRVCLWWTSCHRSVDRCCASYRSRCRWTPAGAPRTGQPCWDRSAMLGQVVIFHSIKGRKLTMPVPLQ